MEALDNERVWNIIHELSDIRAGFSIFDKEKCKKYHAFSLVIKALREIIGEE